MSAAAPPPPGPALPSPIAPSSISPPPPPSPPSAGLFRHLVAILILPGNVLITLPTVLLWRYGFDTLNLWSSRPFTQYLLPTLAFCAATGGLTLMIASIRLFALQGRGTLAPWNPTQRLVVTGPYRYVRNPMISGVCGLLLAETLTTASVYLAGWAALFWLINAIIIPLWEEKELHKQFGAEYELYCRNVPRWIPRLSAWQPPLDSTSR